MSRKGRGRGPRQGGGGRRGRGPSDDRIVYGVGPVTELLAAKPESVLRVLVRQSRGGQASGRLADVASAATAAGVGVQSVAGPDLDDFVGVDARHQGVVAIARPFQFSALADVIATAEASPRPGLIVALDGVTDPHNLGAICRSALLFGAHGIVVPKDRSSAVTAAATKSSAGAVDRLAIAQVVNLPRALGELKDAGYWSAALAWGDRSIPIADLDASSNLVVVLGAEGTGVRRLVGERCDFIVHIPMTGDGVGSLNVSTAAAVALYDIARRR